MRTFTSWVLGGTGIATCMLVGMVWYEVKRERGLAWFMAWVCLIAAAIDMTRAWLHILVNIWEEVSSNAPHHGVQPTAVAGVIGRVDGLTFPLALITIGLAIIMVVAMIHRRWAAVRHYRTTGEVPTDDSGARCYFDRDPYGYEDAGWLDGWFGSGGGSSSKDSGSSSSSGDGDGEAMLVLIVVVLAAIALLLSCLVAWGIVKVTSNLVKESVRQEILSIRMSESWKSER